MKVYEETVTIKALESPFSQVYEEGVGKLIGKATFLAEVLVVNVPEMLPIELEETLDLPSDRNEDDMAKQFAVAIAHAHHADAGSLPADLQIGDKIQVLGSAVLWIEDCTKGIIKPHGIIAKV